MNAVASPIAAIASAPPSLVRHIAGAIGGSAATLVLGLGSSILLNRALGPEGKGSYAAILTTAQLVVLIASFGLAKSITFQLAQPHVNRKALFRSAITVGCVALAAALLLVSLVTALWPAPATRAVFAQSAMWLGLIAVVNIASGCGIGALRGLQCFRETNLFQPLANLTALVLLAGAIALGAVTLSVALACKVGGGILLVALLARVLRREGFSFAPALDRAHVQAVLGYGMAYFGYALFQNLNYRFDTLLVSSLAGSAATGWYSTATGLAEIIWYLPNALSIVLFPVAAGLGARDSDVMIAKFCRWSLHLILLATTTLALVAPAAITLLYGNDFLPAAAAVRALAIGIVTNALFQVLGVRLAARNQLRALTWITLAGFLVNVLANFFLIPRWGFVGAGWASTISYSVTGLLTAWHFTRHSDVPWRELFIIPRAEFASVLFTLRSKVSRG